MDCDYNPAAAAAASVRRPPAELVTGRGRKKRRGRLADLLRRKKPRFDPAGAQPLAEYVEQYYKLDEQANPHPFKYRQVVANDFGLDTEEVRGSRGRGGGRGMDGGVSRRHTEFVCVKRGSHRIRHPSKRVRRRRNGSVTVKTARF